MKSGAVRGISGALVAVLLTTLGLAAAPVSAAGGAAGSVRTADPVTMPGGITPVTPTRVLDTRSHVGVPTTTPVQGGATVTFQVTGRGNVPADNVAGVYLNVTVTQPTQGGYVAAYAGGGSSSSSNLNFQAGQTIPNLVFVPVGTGEDAGKVTLKNGSAGTVHLLADTAGYVRSGNVSGAGAAAPVDPARILDTRNRVGVGTASSVPANGTVTFAVTGQGNIPADNVAGVYLNVTVTRPTRDGYVSAYPAGGSSTGSNLNFLAGQTIPNLVFVPVGTGVNAGKVTLKNGSAGAVHLLADTAGYVRGGVLVEPGAAAPVGPARVLDTRNANGVRTRTAVPANGTVTFSLPGRGHLPANGVAGVFLNVTVTQPTRSGFVAAFPAGGSTNASNLNFKAGQTIPNLVFVPVGEGASSGRVTLKNGSSGTVHLIADTAGYVASRDIAPRLTGQGSPTGNVAVPFRYPVRVTGGEAPYRFSATGLPAGLRIADGVIQGVPTATLPTTPIAIGVVDAQGRRSRGSVSLTIAEGLPGSCAAATGCATVAAKPTTREVPASRIGEITLDSSGAPNWVLVTGDPPAVNDVLVLAPTAPVPTGVVVIVRAVTPQEDGTTLLRVVPGDFGDAYSSGSVRAVGPVITENSVAPPADRPRVVSSDAPPTFGRELPAKPKDTTAPRVAARGTLGCTAGVTPDLQGMNVEPSLTPQFAWQADLGGLKLVQFNLDGTIKVNVGATVAGAGSCTLTLPGLSALVPAGPTGVFVVNIAPTLKFDVNGRMDLRGSVTMNCNIGYKWTNTASIERLSSCGTSYEPLAVTASTGVDLTAVGTLTTSIAWNNVVGINGSIAGTVHAGYHPTGNPVGSLDAKVDANLGGCVLCFWDREELRVTIVNRTIFEQVIASWDSVPRVVSDDPRITTDSLPSAPLGAPYSQRLRTADNRTGTWTVSSGALPHGLSLNGDTIEGKPTNLQGLVTFRIRFTDARGRVAAKDLSIRVIAGTTPPGGAIEDLSYCRRSIIAANDDGASDEIRLPFPMKLGASTYSWAYVGNNGYMTFDGAHSQFTPNPLADWDEPILAPFFADVDTRNPSSDLVTYGASADGTQFCVNWVDVGYYYKHEEKRISAQMIVTRRNDVSPGAVDLTYNYGSIQWETGDASDGSYGIGGKPARVGYATGDGTYLELTGSGQTGAFLDGGPRALISGSRGSSTPGRYVIQLR